MEDDPRVPPCSALSLVSLFCDWLNDRGESDIKLYATRVYNGECEYAVFIRNHPVGWVSNYLLFFECTDTHLKYDAADPEFFEKCWKHIEYTLSVFKDAGGVQM